LRAARHSGGGAAATGKAIMAFQRKKLAEALSHNLPKPTNNSRTSKKWIEQEFAKVRTTGYATCVGEIDEGPAAIFVPVNITEWSGASFHRHDWAAETHH
jgi:DNA-binding IclR family transcriptional regulator